MQLKKSNKTNNNKKIIKRKATIDITAIKCSLKNEINAIMRRRIKATIFINNVKCSLTEGITVIRITLRTKSKIDINNSNCGQKI